MFPYFQLLHTPIRISYSPFLNEALNQNILHDTHLIYACSISLCHISPIPASLPIFNTPSPPEILNTCQEVCCLSLADCMLRLNRKLTRYSAQSKSGLRDFSKPDERNSALQLER